MSHFTIIALLISFDKKKMANETTFFEAKPHSHGIVWYSDIVTLFIQLVRDETSVDRIVLVFFFVVFNSIVDKNFGSKARIGDGDTSMSYDKHT